MKKDGDNVGKTIIVVVLVTIALIVLALVLWYYVIAPYRKVAALKSQNVSCTTAPNAPSGAAASPSGNSVILNWGAVTNFDSYTVYVGKVSGFTRQGALRTITVKTNSTTVINLIPGNYVFVITAVNTCGESTNSNEAFAVITTFPSTIKLCKVDNPTFCLFLPSLAGQNARVSTACPSGGCNIDYLGQNKLALSPSDTLCLESNFIVVPNIENDVSVENCSATIPQTWTIDLTTQRVSNPQGLCLGSTLVPESFAFNTDCSSVLAGDTRYHWTPQAI